MTLSFCSGEISICPRKHFSSYCVNQELTTKRMHSEVPSVVHFLFLTDSEECGEECTLACPGSSVNVSMKRRLTNNSRNTQYGINVTNTWSAWFGIKTKIYQGKQPFLPFEPSYAGVESMNGKCRFYGIFSFFK